MHTTTTNIYSDGKGGWKVPSGKGLRLIISHACGENGWVDGTDLVFMSKMNTGDYHDEMNSEHFMEWMREPLLPRLEEPSVILGNASYHNKQKDKSPTASDKKEDIKAWLDRHETSYSDTDIKKTLLDKVKQHRPNPLYLTDEAVHEHGLQYCAFLWPTASSIPLS